MVKDFQYWESWVTVYELGIEQLKRRVSSPPSTVLWEVSEQVNAFKYHSDKHYMKPERETKIIEDDER